MSGYATDVLGDRDRPDAASELLNKPFRRAELAEPVRARTGPRKDQVLCGRYDRAG